MNDGDAIRPYLAAFDFEDEDSPAWARKVLEVLERVGAARRMDEFVTTPDGVTGPSYKLLLEGEELEEAYRSAEFQVSLNELEKRGLIRKTGEYRRAPNGELQPAYVVADEN